MKIKKDGKVINLTESDLQRIVKRVMNEGGETEGGTPWTLDEFVKNFKGGKGTWYILDGVLKMDVTDQNNPKSQTGPYTLSN